MNKRTERSVETWGSAASQTILSEGFDGALFDMFVARETSKVKTGKVESSLSS